MNASGGAAAPINDASEEFGATAPKHERQEDDDNDHNAQSGTAGSSNRQINQQSSNSGSGISKGNQQSSGGGSANTKSNQQSSSHSSSNHQGNQSSSSHSTGTSKTTQSSSSHSSSTTKTTQQSSTSSHDLEQISRDKAQRYTNLNEEDVQHAGAPDKNKSEAERSRQRAPKDAGPKEDVEQLHGKATLAGNDRSDDKSGAGGQQGGKSGSGQQSGKSGGGGRGVEVEYKGHGPEDPMRHNAEKFVNLDD
jgi:hypothetical protein